MPQLLIPHVGTTLTLTEDWDFRLYGDYRNWDLFQLLGLGHYQNYCLQYDYETDEYSGVSFAQVSLPRKAVLKVRRVYIRQAFKKNETDETSYDSLTFSLTHHPGDYPKKRKTGDELKTRPRFWVKLADVNEMVCEIDPDTMRMRNKHIVVDKIDTYELEID